MNLGSDALPKRQLRAARTVEQSPTVIGAPLGKWSEVTIPMRLGITHLPLWNNYRVGCRVGTGLLAHLARSRPTRQPICRTVGRYCDATILILGPETCASPTWLRRHIDHLTECDTSLTGSLLVSATQPRSQATLSIYCGQHPTFVHLCVLLFKEEPATSVNQRNDLTEGRDGTRRVAAKSGQLCYFPEHFHDQVFGNVGD